MPQDVSVAFRQAAEAVYSSEPVLVLARISHRDLANPIRIANNTEDVTSNGETYIGFPFELSLPDERKGSVPRGHVAVQNVDRQIGLAVKHLTSPPTVDLYVVLASDPDTLEISVEGLRLNNISGDASTIEGDLGPPDDWAKLNYGRRATQARFPGLYR